MSRRGSRPRNMPSDRRPEAMRCTRHCSNSRIVSVGRGYIGGGKHMGNNDARFSRHVCTEFRTRWPLRSRDGSITTRQGKIGRRRVSPISLSLPTSKLSGLSPNIFLPNYARLISALARPWALQRTPGVIVGRIPCVAATTRLLNENVRACDDNRDPYLPPFKISPLRGAAPSSGALQTGSNRFTVRANGVRHEKD